MQVSCVPLSDFVHGQIVAREGAPVEMDASLAGELERAGLVRVNMVPDGLLHSDRASREAYYAKKVAAAGQDVASFALPAVPVLPQTTLPSSNTGKGKVRKGW